ncbi:TPOR protein, partial [Chloroceryle aenea]|nr:TPOR protein [Chloroceryle aenea]
TDAALLAGVPEDILCFSRSFEDLTCFWDEEGAASGMCHFYYWYTRDVPKACTVSTWRQGAGRTRHVCVFPSQDVRLFTQLHLHVLDASTNQSKYWRELSVDAVGESLPPGNTPLTPGHFPDLGLLPFGPAGSRAGTQRGQGRAGGLGGHGRSPAWPFVLQGLVQANTWVVLRDLRPGARYHI